MKELLKRIMADDRYLGNIEYGEPRSGHPEGKIKHHIVELEQNLEKLARHEITEEQYWKLKFLIHVHDTFKREAKKDAAIMDPQSHSSLARKYASDFTADTDLLNMIQYHDLNFALWKQVAASGSYDQQRLTDLIQAISDWDLFLMFIIIDGCTNGKDPDKTLWFIEEVRKYKETAVDGSWML